MGPVPYRYEFAEALPGETEDSAGGFRPCQNPDPIASGPARAHSKRVHAPPEPVIVAVETRPDQTEL